MKIIWYSDSPLVTTAYGKIGAEVLPRLHKLGHEILVVPKFGHYGKPIQLGYGWMVGIADNNYNLDMIVTQAQAFHPDIVVFMVDIWGINMREFRQSLPRTLIVSYMPLDTNELAQLTKDALGYIDYVIPMSQHCEQVLRSVYKESKGMTDRIMSFIYPAISFDFKYDPNLSDKRKIGFFGYDFVIAIVQMNKDVIRKDQIRQLMAIRDAINHIHETYPDYKIGIYLHLESQGAFDVKGFTEELGIDRITRCPLPQDYYEGFKDSEMAEIYNSVDLVVQCTTGEGFGMPTAEAAICGTPVVGVKNTATKELMEYSWPQFAVDADETMFLSIAPTKIANYTKMVGKIEKVIGLTMFHGSLKNREVGKIIRILTDPDKVAQMWDDAFIEIMNRYEIRCGAPPLISNFLVEKREKIITVKR